MDIIEVSAQCLKEHWHKEFILTCDIGGTHCRFGIVGVEDNHCCDILAYHIHHTSEIRNEHIFVDCLNNFLKEIYDSYNISISSCVVAAGGPVNNNYVELVNHNLKISVEFIKTHTMLTDVLILNDLVAIAYGIYYNKEKAQMITPHLNPEHDGPLLVVAPGTGLGQAIVHVDDAHPVILPMESGHMDFVAYDNFDFGFVKFIQRLRNSDAPVEFEDAVSGRGICNIFRYLISLEENQESIDVVHAKMILKYDIMLIPMLLSRYITTNKFCQMTFDVFYRYLARYCKNISLTNLTQGGLFIGGGMIEHNKESFNADTFLVDFINHTDTRFSEILAQIPISIFSDSFMGVKGAARALIEKKK